MLMNIIANLLFLVGVFYCLVNFCIALRNYLRGTHASAVPFMGTIFMSLGCLLLPAHVPAPAVLLFLLYDLSGLPSLLLLPFYLLLRALRGAEAPPLLPRELKLLLVALYMVVTSILVLALWLTFFVTGGEMIPNQA